ncbi:MAG: hypothetical protein ACOYY3_05330 [Chloroflexota bacterium]
MSKRNLETIYMPLLGLAAIVLVMYGIDLLTGMFKKLAPSTFRSVAYYWSLPLFTLVTGLLLLLLFWSVMHEKPRSQWVGLSYLVIGLFMVTAFNLLMSVNLPFQFKRPLYPIIETVIPTTFLFRAGGFIAAMGFLSLVLPGEKSWSVKGGRRGPQAPSALDEPPPTG